MKRVTRHISRCFIAGFVALLPIGGLVFTVAYAEALIVESWLVHQPFYFPGLGLLTVAAVIYLIGFIVSTLLGRWIWSAVDRFLNRLPAVGQLYRTLKQILGYGEGDDAIFQRVVLVPSKDPGAEELGLVTRESASPGSPGKLTVFVPGAPNPTTGRLLLIDTELVRPVEMSVNEALKALVSVGKSSPLG